MLIKRFYLFFTVSNHIELVLKKLKQTDELQLRDKTKMQ